MVASAPAPALVRRALLGVAAALGAASPALAQDPAPAPPVNPCADPALRCPDLVMAPPTKLEADASPSGRRVVLRMENRIVNVGLGPASLRGRRRDYSFMDAQQVIHDVDGGRRLYPTGALLEYTSVPTRGGDYWKMESAARFELWRIDAEGERTEMVRVGPKLNYCLRDLDRVRRGALVPRRIVFPACNQSRSARTALLGTSVGWADVYPEDYPNNWIDVTGRRGCYSVVHRVDPDRRIFETDETNNVASRLVRFPYRPGPQRCP